MNTYRQTKPKVEKADGKGIVCRSDHASKILQRQKNRFERRKAKLCPDCLPTYTKYAGWEA